MRSYRFGAYRLEPAERRLTRDGETVSLRPKVFDTLVALVANADRLMEKEELIHIVWGGSIVEEGNLPNNISVLRRVLGEGRTDEQYIETVPTRGYRFVAPVKIDSAETTAGDEPAESLVEQEIRLTRAADGIRIAYAVAGSGLPLVKTANWLNHLEFDWRSPVWRHLMRELSSHYTLVRYDERGNGLSDWEVGELSLDTFVSDLETIVDTLDLERFPLLGISQGCAVAIVYAVRHPGRVSRLVLHGGFAEGWKVRDRKQAAELSSGRLEIELIRTGWGQETPAFRQAFASLYMPGATPEQSRSWTELQRVCTSPENAARLLEAFGEIDVLELLPRLSLPTLVLHSRNDATVPYSSGRELAARIPGARFVPLDSVNHLILEHEPAWPVFRDAVLEFLSEDDG